jgi:hypothetical protein
MRFFFNLHDGGWEPDGVGTELADVAAAQREAVRFVGEVLKSEPRRLASGRMQVDVHDEEMSSRFSVVVLLETHDA